MVTLGKGIKMSKVGGDGLTGRLAQEEVLYPCNCDCHNCKSDFELLKRIIESQPSEWDPTNPKPIIANNLHAIVAIALGLEDWSELRIYTLLGTILDKRGFDFILMFRGKIITGDITVNFQKYAYLADFVFNVQLDAEGTALKRFGQEIAKMFKSGRTKEYNPALVL